MQDGGVPHSGASGGSGEGAPTSLGGRSEAWRTAAVAFGASGAVLVLETIAGRMLAPYVGVSLETFTGIIGTCLAGIALGAAIGGATADRAPVERLRRLVPGALVLGGGFAWSSVPITAALGPALGSGPVAIVLLTAAAFAPAVVVLSSVAPMLAKLRLHRLDETGTVVGGLSAAGTLGALAGTFLTGFVAVALFSSRTVVLVTGALLVAAGAVVGWRLGRRRPDPLAVVALLVLGGGVLVTSSPCEYETSYFCARIVEDPDEPSLRHLYLDRLRHASVDLDDPSALPIRYTRVLGAVAAAMDPGALDVLHVGGGGFSFPRYLSEVRPGTRNHVLELDGDLVDIARRHLGLRLGPDLTVRVGDARLALADGVGDDYDLVVGDAFGGEAAPWHLTTVEVARDVHRLLRPGGVYAINLIDGAGSRLVRAELATLREVFDHVGLVVPRGGVPLDRAVNQVLVASDAPLREPRLAPRDGWWVTGDELDRFVGDARPLTDEHAPVDQLIHR